MQQIIDDLRGLETEHGGSDLALTRGKINRAIALSQVPEKPGQIRSILDDPSYEDERARLIKALMDDNEFLDHVAGNRVTFGMIKPHVNLAKLTDKTDDEVADMIMGEVRPSLELLVARHTHMPLPVSQRFYGHLEGIINDDDDVFDRVTKFMSSGAITGLVLFSPNGNAITDWRSQIGATDPQKATPDTMRAKFATNITNNVLHGADSIESVQLELDFFKSLL